MAPERTEPFVPHSVGERIGHARRLLGVWEGEDVLVTDLAKRVGVTAESVYNWESDDAVPGKLNFEKLATVLRVTVAYLHYGVQVESTKRVAEMPAESFTTREQNAAASKKDRPA